MFKGNRNNGGEGQSHSIVDQDNDNNDNNNNDNNNNDNSDITN